MLFLIYGDIGSGKTFTSVLLTEMLYQENNNLKIFTNCKYKNQTGDLLEIFNPDVQNDIDSQKLLIFDEIDKFADSRNSSSKTNIMFSYLLSLSRKINLDIIATTQLYKSMDLRYRDLSNISILPELNKDTGLLRLEIYKHSNSTLYNKKFQVDLEKVYSLYETKYLTLHTIKYYKSELKKYVKDF